MLSRTTFHVLLAEEYVAAANTGRPFSREGLRTVCGADFTSKGAATEDSPFADSKEVNEFLKEVRDEQVGAYNSRPRYIAEEAEREKKLRREYAARVLPELIQNAHDAATDHPIGKYGVGFKAVLNVSDGPRIHSAKLHCCFDPLLARNELSHAGLLKRVATDIVVVRLRFGIKNGIAHATAGAGCTAG